MEGRFKKASWTPMKVLIIDDNRMRIEQIQSELAENDIVELDIADNAMTGKKYLANKQYDFLILDVVLPRRKDDTAKVKEGIALLNEIHSPRLRMYKTPASIVGITADASDIDQFIQHFQSLGVFLLDVKTNDNWLNILVKRIEFQTSHLLAYEPNNKDKLIINVHGIRTYGCWQTKFKDTIEKNITGTSVHPYRYGYEAALSFFFPWRRKKHISNFYKKLERIAEEEPEKNIYIFAHSFGTLIVVEALKMALESKLKLNINRIVLAGSILDCSYDLEPIYSGFDCSVICESSDKDYVLIFSKMFVPKAGMAGREGFEQVHKTDKIINRFYNFGHSGYLDQVQIESNWLPLLSSKIEPKEKVNYSTLDKDFINPFAKLYAKLVKKYALLFYPALLVYLFFI